VKSLLTFASSYGAADRPLRHYIALFEALEQVLGVRGAVRTERQARYLSLVRTWGFHLMRALDLRGAYILYVTRKGQVPIFFGEQDEQTKAAVLQFAAQAQETVFQDVNDVLMFQVGMASFRIVGALRQRDVWAAEDIGFAADSLDLLRRITERARRRELDKIAQAITDRQTMLKELRPNSLYYNLLHALEHVAYHNHSSVVLRCAEDHAIVAAEIIRYPALHGSTRVGRRLPLPAVALESLDGCVAIHADDPNTELGNLLCAELYGSDWRTNVKSVLLVPLDTAEPLQRFVAALADSHPLFFVSADLGAVDYIAKRTAAIISNTVNFATRLDRTSSALDEVILTSRSQSELLERATAWTAETFKTPFETPNVRIILAGDIGSAEASGPRGATNQASELVPAAEIPAEYVARLIQSGRALYTRLSPALAAPPGPTFAAFFGAPLNLLDGRVGAVVCRYTKPRQASPFEHFLLDAAAQRIGAALTIRALGDHQLEELRLALRLMEVVAAAADDIALMNLLTSEVKSLLGADYCFVSVPDDTGTLHLQAKTWKAEFDVPPIRVTGNPGDGITGLVAFKNHIYRAGDVTTDRFYRDVVGAKAPIRSEMAGPLFFEGQLLGVIDLMSSRTLAFSEQDETLFQMLLTHSSVALAHAKSARADRDHIVLTNQLHSRLLKLTTPDEIYAMLLETAIACVGDLHPGHNIYGNLYVKHPGVRFLEVKAFVGRKSNKFSPTLYFNEGVVGKVASTGRFILIADTSAPPPGVNFAPFIEEITQGSEIAVPTGIGGEVDAVINLESPTPFLFGSNDLAALEALAHEISLAVRFAQLNESVLIDKQRQERNREMRFLANFSHVGAKSAEIASLLLPQLERLVADRPEALKLVALVRTPADEAVELRARLLRSLARPKTDYEEADVIAELHSASRAIQNAHSEVAVEIHVTPAAFEVACSSDSLRLVFKNLFDNAIAAMKGAGQLTISEHGFNDQNTLVIDITDTGHGIASDKHERIWEAFYSDDGTGHTKGFGLGLSIVKDQMEHMGGHVTLHRSAPGEGTTFRLTFSAR
jgi:signal transduction histidine kinase